MSQVPSQPTSPEPPPDWQPGQPLAGYGVVVPQRTSAAAVTSLVLGILGCVPLIIGLLAVGFGVAGIRTTRDPRIRGRGIAIAGLVLGLVSVVGWSLFGGLLGVGYARSRPARAVAEQFTSDLAAGDVTTAQSRCTGTVARPSLDAAAASMRPWGPLSDFTASSFNYGVFNGTETCTLTGVATFANARANFSFRFVKQGGAFQVDAFSFANQNGAATPATAPASATSAAIARVNAPMDALPGVLLGADSPELTPAPSMVLSFETAASRNYLSISPLLKQPFFIGDGLTSSQPALQRDGHHFGATPFPTEPTP